MGVINFITSLQYVIDGVWSQCGGLFTFFFKYVSFLLRGNWDIGRSHRKPVFGS